MDYGTRCTLFGCIAQHKISATGIVKTTVHRVFVMLGAPFFIVLQDIGTCFSVDVKLK